MFLCKVDAYRIHSETPEGGSRQLPSCPGTTDTKNCNGNEPILALRKPIIRINTRIELNLRLANTRWRWSGHTQPIVLGRLASKAKVRLGCDATGWNCLGENAFYFLSYSPWRFVHFPYSIVRVLIGMVHQRPMHSQPFLPSPDFYPPPVLEDGRSGVSMPTRASSSWATRMVDKVHGTWRAGGPIVSPAVSPILVPSHSFEGFILICATAC